MAEAWCVSVGSGDMQYDQCMQPEVMILAIVIECGFYLLVGAGLWGVFKRWFHRKQKERQRVLLENEKWNKRI